MTHYTITLCNTPPLHYAMVGHAPHLTPKTGEYTAINRAGNPRDKMSCVLVNVYSIGDKMSCYPRQIVVLLPVKCAKLTHIDQA